jgi:hypothetical protein
MKYIHALGWMLARIRFLCQLSGRSAPTQSRSYRGPCKSSVLQEAIWLPHLNISKGSRRLADSPLPTLFIRIAPEAGCRFSQSGRDASRVTVAPRPSKAAPPAVQPP